MNVPSSLLKKLLLGTGLAITFAASQAPVRAQGEAPPAEPPAVQAPEVAPSPSASPDGPTLAPEPSANPSPKEDKCEGCGRG
jgi:hypothetical protein